MLPLLSLGVKIFSLMPIIIIEALCGIPVLKFKFRGGAIKQTIPFTISH
jgi:hypothetical protein